MDGCTILRCEINEFSAITTCFATEFTKVLYFFKKTFAG